MRLSCPGIAKAQLCLLLLPQTAPITNNPREKGIPTVLPHTRVLQPHLLVFTGEGLWGTDHVLTAELSAPKMILASAAHLDVKGPGARYDFKKVVSHQEVTRNSEKETVTPQQPSWTEENLYSSADLECAREEHIEGKPWILLRF